MPLRRFLLTSLCVLGLNAMWGTTASAAVPPVRIDTLSPDHLPSNVQPAEETVVPALSHVPGDSLTTVIVSRLQQLVGNPIFERTQLGLYVYDLTADAPVFACGEHQQLRPASNEKLVTAVTALCRLGTGFNYSTRLYRDGEVRDGVLYGNLYLRGGFDPFLDASDVSAMLDSLRRDGIRAVRGRVLFDRSLKDTASLGWGWCWDDEAIPLTPLLLFGKTGLEKYFLERLTAEGFCDSVPTAVSYAKVSGKAVLAAERLHSIDQVLLPMMKESDNLCAESLFYQIAAQSGQAYAGRKRVVRVVEQLLSDIGVSKGTYQIADGSGLSLYNYLTPYLLVRLLRHAYRDKAVYRHLHPSLPIAGEDGTLRRRMTSGAARGNVCAKTGTVEGVSTLSGYCTAANGHLFCFSIMNQGIRRTSTGRSFQDRVCRALTDK